MNFNSPVFNRVTIIGVGLIGGSFSLNLLAKGIAKEIVGVDRDTENLQKALNLGVVNRIESDLSKAVQGADLVVIATPVGQMENIMQSIAPHLSADTIVTDVGSTKQNVVKLAVQYLPDHLSHFVPAHPIAGAESSGVEAAKIGLFKNRSLILTPLAETSPDAVNKLKSVWTQCDAKVTIMTASSHDRIFAAVSHLPHLLAFALVNEIANRDDAKVFFDFAGTGFRDFTRIASSSPEMWRDISLANREALLRELESYQHQLNDLHRMLQTNSARELDAVFTKARDARNAWLKKSKL